MTTTANSKVLIKGKLFGAKLKGELYYTTPINGFEDLYFHDQKAQVTSDSTFRIEAQIEKAGFLLIKFPGRLIKLFVQPNDTLALTANFVVDSRSKQKVLNALEFQGPNSEGHKLFNAENNYSNQRLLESRGFQKKASSMDGFFLSSQKVLLELIQPFDSLYNLHAINKEYHQAAIGSLKGAFGWSMINLFGYLAKQSGKQLPDKEAFRNISIILSENKELFTPANEDSLRLMLYKTYYPFDTNMLYTNSAIAYSDWYAQDLFRNIIKDTNTIQYDSMFLELKASKHYYGYFSGKFLEAHLAGDLYYSAATEPDSSELIKSYEIFTAHFPSSGFLPFLKQRLSISLSDIALEVDAKADIVFVNQKEYGSLKELVIEQFNSKYVFVDLWATWCSPCIQDMLYQNQTKTFLNSKKIQVLYISLDDKTKEDRWKHFVNTKKLVGKHYLGTEKLISQIKTLLYDGKDVYIPRYLILDKDGNILNNDLPRPSDPAAFKGAIEKLLETR